MKKIILTQDAPSPIGPYSQAVQFMDLLFISGQIALDKEGRFHNQDISTETRMVMANLGQILAAAGASYSSVLKCTIFLKNMNDFAIVNSIYGEFFSQNFPARETVEVSGLPKDANVEISCIAMINK